jgi:hypothetical protein
MQVSNNYERKLLTKTLTSLDFIQMGQISANALQEEISFQCFYIAHLMDPDNIKTNSELQFYTYDPSKSMTLEE